MCSMYPFPSQSRNGFGVLLGFTREDFGLFFVHMDGDLVGAADGFMADRTDD